MAGFIETYGNRRMLLLLMMAFSSGLPLALTAGTLQAWMTTVNVDLSTIGIFTAVGLPYTLKFVWAPVMDRFVPPVFGRRRGWMILTQLGLIAFILLLGSSDPVGAPLIVASLAVGVSFLSASQDIVIDAYRAEILSKEELGAGAGVAILGYRLGMLTSGALGLILADHLPWQSVYAIMAIAMLVGLIAAVLGPEPEGDAEAAPRTMQEAVVQPFIDYFRRPGSVEILVFIILYKLGDVMAAALNTSFLLQLGFTKTEIGAVAKAFGLIATIVGSIVGGGFVAMWGIKRALLIFGVLQGLSTVFFAVLAAAGRNHALMTFTVGFENLTAGLGNAPFIAFLMSLCNRRFTATQYALLTSLAAVSRIIAGVPSGFFVEAYGWVNWYLLCAFMAIPAIAMLRARYDVWDPGEKEAASRSG